MRNRMTTFAYGSGTGSSNPTVDTSGRTAVASSSSGAPSWVLPGASLDMNFKTGETWGGSGLTITRASTSSLTWADGTVSITPASTPAISNLGLLGWGAVQNICLQSQFGGASWTATRSVLTANAVASPENKTTAATLVEDATATNTHLTVQAFSKAASALPYTYSVYAKTNTRTRIMLQIDDNAGNGAFAGFDLAGGQIAYAAAGLGTPYTAITATIRTFLNGWCRCELNATSNTAVAQNVSVYLDSGSGTGVQSTTYSGDGVSGVFVWGAQLEQTVVIGAGPYIATTTIAVTRNSDVITLTNSPTFGTSYTMFVQATPYTGITDAGTQGAFGVDDGSSNNRMFLERVLTTGNGQVRSVTGGSGTTISMTNAWTQYASGKMAAKNVTGSQRAVLNNGTAATGTGVLPVAVTTVRISTTTSAGTGNWLGYIERIAIWPSIALDNTTLASITV